MQTPWYVIKQIMPAVGWYAHLFNDKSEIDLTRPLVCWALIEKEDGETVIWGMVEYMHQVTPGPCVDCHPQNDRISFVGYVTQQTVDSWARNK